MRMACERSSGKRRRASRGCRASSARFSSAVAISSIGVKAENASLASIATTRAAGSFRHAPAARPWPASPCRALHSPSAQSTGRG